MEDGDERAGAPSQHSHWGVVRERPTNSATTHFESVIHAGAVTSLLYSHRGQAHPESINQGKITNHTIDIMTIHTDGIQ